MMTNDTSSSTARVDHQVRIIVFTDSYVTPILDTTAMIVRCSPLRPPARLRFPVEILQPQDFFQRAEPPQLLSFAREVDRDLQLAQLRSRAAFELLMERSRAASPRAPRLPPRRMFSQLARRPGFRGSRESKRVDDRAPARR